MVGLGDRSLAADASATCSASRRFSSAIALSLLSYSPMSALNHEHGPSCNAKSAASSGAGARRYLTAHGGMTRTARRHTAAGGLAALRCARAVHSSQRTTRGTAVRIGRRSVGAFGRRASAGPPPRFGALGFQLRVLLAQRVELGEQPRMLGLAACAQPRPQWM